MISTRIYKYYKFVRKLSKFFIKTLVKCAALHSEAATKFGVLKVSACPPVC